MCMHACTDARTDARTQTHCPTTPDLSDAGGEPGPSCLHCVWEPLPSLQELLLLLWNARPVVGEEGQVDHVRVDLNHPIHHCLEGLGLEET